MAHHLETEEDSHVRPGTLEVIGGLRVVSVRQTVIALKEESQKQGSST